MINKLLAERALNAALSTGGDFAELFFEDRLNNGVTLRSGKTEEISSGRQHGVGVRILKGIRQIYAYSNDTTEDGLIAAAKKAAAALSGSAGVSDVKLVGSVIPNIHRIKKLPADIETKRRIEYLRSSDAAMREVGAEITQTLTRYIDWDQQVTIANSDGLFVNDRRVYTRVVMTAIASSGTESQVGSRSPGAMAGAEFADNLDVEGQSRIAARLAITSLHADACPAGMMPVVIDK